MTYDSCNGCSSAYTHCMADVTVKLEDVNNTLTSQSSVEKTWIMLWTPGGRGGRRLDEIELRAMVYCGHLLLRMRTYYTAIQYSHFSKMAAIRELTLENDDRPAERRELLPTELLPKAVPRDRSKDDRGGYDCEFVEPPPSGLRTECPVCLLVLKEPCLISCCGHKFCRECIERIKKDKKPCPLCNEPDFTFLRERALERDLKDLEVWCSYRKEGCEWKGKLRKLEEHLNRDPSPENRLNGCQFVAVECTYKCGAWFQRRHITTHETQQCKKRPYSCDYCRDYHSTFEDVTEVHYPQCGKYPVACPNDCDVYKFERQKLETHLREECPLSIVDCPFHFAGCETQLPRKDMPEHSKENVIHLTLLATAMQKLVKENQELRHEVQQLVSQSGFPVEKHVKQTDEEVYLPPFYTHPHGYRMYVRVDPNGVGHRKGTHVSISTYMMRGPFDDYLKWPFRGEITIQIVNQVGDHDHMEKIIHYTDRTPDDTAGRVTGKEKADKGRGYHFLAHDKLQYNAERRTQYLKYNTLHIRVMKVTLS